MYQIFSLNVSLDIIFFILFQFYFHALLFICLLINLINKFSNHFLHSNYAKILHASLFPMTMQYFTTFVFKKKSTKFSKGQSNTFLIKLWRIKISSGFSYNLGQGRVLWRFYDNVVYIFILSVLKNLFRLIFRVFSPSFSINMIWNLKECCVNEKVIFRFRIAGSILVVITISELKMGTTCILKHCMTGLRKKGKKRNGILGTKLLRLRLTES